MQQADMRVDALDNLAVHLHDHAQHAVRGGMLRAEVERVVPDQSFGHQVCFPSGSVTVAFSSPASIWREPSHGLRKSKERNSWVRLTGS